MGRAGFEPATLGLRVPCSAELSYRPVESMRKFSAEFANGKTHQPENSFCCVEQLVLIGGLLPWATAKIGMKNKIHCRSDFSRDEYTTNDRDISSGKQFACQNLFSVVLRWNSRTKNLNQQPSPLT